MVCRRVLCHSFRLVSRTLVILDIYYKGIDFGLLGEVDILLDIADYRRRNIQIERIARLRHLVVRKCNTLGRVEVATESLATTKWVLYRFVYLVVLLRLVSLFSLLFREYEILAIDITLQFNTNEPSAPGTMIVASTEDYDHECVITGVAGKKGFSAINIEKDSMNSTVGFVRQVLEILEDNDLSFEHLPSGIDTMTLVINTEQFEPHRDRVLNAISRSIKPDSLSVEDGFALIAVVGRGMVKVKGTAAKVFDAVSDAGVNIRMIDQGSSEINIIIGVDEKDFVTSMQAIYNKFANKN